VYSQLINQENIENSAFNKIAAMIGFTLISVIQFAMAIFHLVKLNDLLPRSGLFSASSEAVDMTIVLHQSVLIILQFLPAQNSRINFWIISIVSLGFSIVALYLHFSRLPNHNVKALYYRGYLLGLVGLLNLILVIRVIVISSSEEYVFGVDTSLIIFGGLGVIVIKLIRSYLNKTLLDIISLPAGIKSERKQLYKISIMKHLFKSKIPLDEGSKPTDWHYLLFTTASLKTNIIFNLNKEMVLNKNTTDKKTVMKQIFVKHLEGLLVQHPKSDLIKLYIAYYHGKKLLNFEPAVKMLSKLEQTRTHNIKASACLLKRDIENLMKEPVLTGKTSAHKVNIRPYLDSRITFSRLQGEVLKQASLQIRIYQEYIKDDPDVSKIFESSQQVIAHQRSLLKAISSKLARIPDSFLAPYFLLQGYFAQVAHSYPDYKKCCQAISFKYQRFQKSWTSSYLTQDNVYNHENVFLVISGQRESLGQIHYSSNSALQSLGWDAKALTGRNILTIIPQSFQKIYQETMNNFTQETLTNNLSDQSILRIFLVHRAGYILQADLCIAIHPFMERGFFLDLVIRIVPENKDYFIVTSEGKIEGFTNNIGTKLGFLKNSWREGGAQKVVNHHNVELEILSNRLGEVNKALNFIEQFRNKPEPMGGYDEKGMVSLSTYSDVMTKRNSTPELSDKTIRGFTRRTRTMKLTMYPGQTDLPKAMEFMNNFLNQGEEVILNPLAGKKSDHEEELNSYHCKIEERAFPNSAVIRLYVLQENISKMDSSDISNIMDGLISPRGLLKTSKKQEVEESSAEESTSQEDQEEGDITFKKDYFESPATSPFKKSILVKGRFSGGSNDNTTLEPASSQRLLVMSSPIPEVRIGQNEEMSKPKKQVIIAQDQAKKEERMLRELAAEANHSIGSQSSQRMGYERVTKAYQKAILMKYYPGYIVKCFLFILAIYIVLFSLQLDSGLKMNDNFSDAQAKKDVIQAAELRNYLLIEIDDLVRYEVQTLTTFLNSGAGIPDLSILPYLVIEAKILGETNHKLLEATSSLDNEDRERLFKRDVKIYDTYFHDENPVYINLTNFEAVDAISVAINRGFSFAVANDANGIVQALKFVLRNSVNELLLRTEDTVEIFIKSMGEFEKSSQSFLLSRFLVNFYLLILSLVIVTVIIWIQYRKEKQNILAFSRLSTEEAGIILEKLIEFKKSVEDETYYAKEKKRYEDKPGGGAALSSSPGLKDVKNKMKKGHREVRYQGTIRSYMMHTMKIFVFVVILLGIFSLEFNVMKKKVELVYTKLAQLHYSNWMLGRISMLYVSLIELLAEEEMIIVRNQPAYDQVIESLAQVEDIMNTITSGYFSDGEGNYDAKIFPLLFGDICAPITDPMYLYFCTSLQKDSKVFTYVNLLSNMRFYSQLYFQAYIASNKTLPELIMINSEAGLELLGPLLTLQGATKSISGRLNEIFEESIAEAKKQNTMICVVLDLLLVVAVGMIWFSILRVIRESDNKFKNMLSIFPHNYILSNFMLKAYLKKTSEEALNLVKNQI